MKIPKNCSLSARPISSFLQFNSEKIDKDVANLPSKNELDPAVNKSGIIV
jgi:hypothetical protein